MKNRNKLLIIYGWKYYERYKVKKQIGKSINGKEHIKKIPWHDSLNMNSLILKYIQNGGYIDRFIPRGL